MTLPTSQTLVKFDTELTFRGSLSKIKIHKYTDDLVKHQHGGAYIGARRHTLEESLSITTSRCDLAIATHARKMHKKISI
jgi:hypothetical protein